MKCRQLDDVEYWNIKVCRFSYVNWESLFRMPIRDLLGL